jgi:hypothetical protein
MCFIADESDVSLDGSIRSLALRSKEHHARYTNFGTVAELAFNYGLVICQRYITKWRIYLYKEPSRSYLVILYLLHGALNNYSFSKKNKCDSLNDKLLQGEKIRSRGKIRSARFQSLY